MSEPTSLEKADRILWGRALKKLRQRTGTSIYEAASGLRRAGQPPTAAPAGISAQRWQQFEKGSYQFTEEQIGRLTAALNTTPEELEMERAKLVGQRPRSFATGLAEREPAAFVIPILGRAELQGGGWTVREANLSEGSLDLRDLVTPSMGVVRVAGEEMRGWADPGELVIFDRARRPTMDKGCVVETKAGDLYPRLFAGHDEEHVFARTMISPTPIAFRQKEIKGVYAVRFRGD